MSILEPKGSLNFFCDESDLDEKELEIGMMVIGGYYIPKSDMLKLDEAVVNVKSDNNLDERDPIKWSVPYYDEDYKDMLDKINEVGGIEKLRIDMLSIVEKLINMRVLMVSLYKYRPEARDATWKVGFEWVLQRLSIILNQKWSELNKKANYPFLDVICDWFPSPSKRSEFFKVYQDAYIDGFRNLRGSPPALRKLKACPCLLFSSSRFSLALQLSDFLVGATRRFILWCFADKPERYIEDVKKYFSIIYNAFRSYPRMGVVGYGLTAPNESSRKRLRDKLRELKKLKII